MDVSVRRDCVHLAGHGDGVFSVHRRQFLWVCELAYELFAFSGVVVRLEDDASFAGDVFDYAVSLYDVSLDVVIPPDWVLVVDVDQAGGQRFGTWIVFHFFVRRRWCACRQCGGD